MPIHDQSYRRYAGQRAPLGRSWTVIAKAGVMTMLRKRLFIGLLLFAWLPFVVYAVLIYFAANYPQTAAWFPLDAKMFRGFLERQDFFVFVMTIYVGAGLIANDRRANALQIYLSKPLMRAEYISGNFVFLKNNLFLFPAISLASVLQALLASFTMLALSSLSKSSRYVGILYSGIIFFTAAIYGAMYAITGSTSVSWLSVGSNLAQVVDVIFRQPPRYTTPWQVSLIVVLALIALSISVLERRVRGVEIVT
jgi:hypothetical protein